MIVTHNTELADMADRIALPEHRPFMQHYDGHHNRIDRICRPHDTEIMEKEIFSEAFFSDKTPPWVKLIKMFVIYQNGEACVACPMTCTEGLVALLDKFADTPETRAILEHTREGRDGDFAIGAQYLSEIQGGSDVGANVLEAVQEDGTWRLYGTKFFCSATHADYAVVTAKPAGTDEVALFQTSEGGSSRMLMCKGVHSLVVEQGRVFGEKGWMEGTRYQGATTMISRSSVMPMFL